MLAIHSTTVTNRCRYPPRARPSAARGLTTARRSGRVGRIRASAADAPENEVDMKVWSACRDKVVELGFGPDDADMILRKAHGWKFQGYWRNEKDHEMPTAASLDDRISYLQSLGLDAEKLGAIVRKFPEVLGLDLDTRMKPNVAFLEKTYQMSGEVLAGTVARKPHILGNTVDCSGDCVGECNRCWARF